MKKLLISILVLTVMLGGVASAKEKKWEIKKLKDGSVMIRMNGEVTHGDTLNYSFKKVKGKCDALQETFTFYSTGKNPKFKNLKGKLIPIYIKDMTYNNGKVYGNVRHTAPFMSGNRALFSMGFYKIDEHIKHLSQFKTYDLTIVNDFDPGGKDQPEIIKNFKASDYFDLPNNRWSLKGINEAIIQAQKLCMEYEKNN
jgi:hypothetical protein